MGSGRSREAGAGGGSGLLGGGGNRTVAGPAPGRRQLRLSDYLEAPLHHPWLVVVPLVLSVATATAAALLVPKRYRSSCLVLIKASRVPDKIIANVADELDARRHQTIRQEILSRTRLEKVNQELHPFPDAPTTASAVEAMQRGIDVTFRGSDAFAIAFTHTSPSIAQSVTSRVASLFIEEYRRSRQSQFEGAAEFLDEELEGARRQLEAKEEALRRYKEHNMGRLPEQQEALLSALQRLQNEIQSVEQSLEAAEGRLERFTSRTGDPMAAGAGGGLSEREALEIELARLRQRYTDEHPDVKALAARLESLTKDTRPGSTPASAKEAVPGAQIERARADVRALLERRESLRNQAKTFEARVDQIPRAEQELAVLTRDFNQLRDNYQTVLRRKMDAQMAGRLERRWTDDFEILDEARLPERHSFPNRPLFVVAGLVLGLGLGLGAALLAEIFNPNVISLEDLESIVLAPVLAVLPVIGPQERLRAARHIAVRLPSSPPPAAQTKQD